MSSRQGWGDLEGLAPGRTRGSDAEARGQGTESARQAVPRPAEEQDRCVALLVIWPVSEMDDRGGEKEPVIAINLRMTTCTLCVSLPTEPGTHTRGRTRKLPLSPSPASTPSAGPGSNTYFVSGFSSYKSCVSAAELFTRGGEHAQRNSGVQGRAPWSAVPSKNGVGDPTAADGSSHPLRGHSEDEPDSGVFTEDELRARSSVCALLDQQTLLSKALLLISLHQVS